MAHSSCEKNDVSTPEIIFIKYEGDDSEQKLADHKVIIQIKDNDSDCTENLVGYKGNPSELLEVEMKEDSEDNAVNSIEETSNLCNDTNAKRRKHLTLHEKVRILEEHKKMGRSRKNLCRKYKMSSSSLNKILMQKDCILDQVKTVKENFGNVRKVKRCRRVWKSPSEKSLYMWLVQKLSLGQPVSTRLLQDTAKRFHIHFNGDTNFTASDGWLHRFEQRHGLRIMSTKGEKLSANSEDAQLFRDEFNQFIIEHGYTEDTIYNADETTLFWKMLPNTTLAAGFETEVSGCKCPKDRVTLHVAGNASGTHKLPLTMIGKSKFPMSFRKVGLENLPLIYKSQGKGWMNRTIFIDWFSNIFIPSVKEKNSNPNARFLLLLDNAPCHPSQEELNAIDPQVFVMYLPPNVTPLLQPMDRGVISALKRKYKMSFLVELDGQEFQTTLGLVEFVKKWTLLECCYTVARSWNNVSQDTVKNAWHELLDRQQLPQNMQSVSYVDIQAAIRRLPGCQRMTLENAKNWVNSDNTFPPWKPLTFEDIVKMVSDPSYKDHDNDKEPDAEAAEEEVDSIPQGREDPLSFAE